MRTTISKHDFPAYQAQCGSSCWNRGHIVREALKYAPDALSVQYDSITTGLWVDVSIQTPNGQISRRIYG